HRVSGVRWTDAFLVSCATWIVVGMTQQTQSAYLVWHSIPKAEHQTRNGAALALARPIAVFAMFAAAISFEVARKIDRDHTEFWPFVAFTPALFSLAVICAYTAPGRREATSLSPRWATVRIALDTAALLLGAVLLIYTVASAQAISGLVHIAIRGV